MSVYRQRLPQLDGELFLTDGGIETTLIFHEGLELPYFAAFDLLKDRAGKQALQGYFRRHAAIATANDMGFIMESATWRASSDWGEKLGYDRASLDEANKAAIDLLLDLRLELQHDRSPMVVSGCVGPRGDGYDPGTVMTLEAAENYHRRQIETFAKSDADLVTAITMTNINEAIGVTRAAHACDMPVVISFTVETDGRLPAGDTLESAIEMVDRATDCGPVYYMLNCAHPTHFDDVLTSGKTWVDRIRGLRANASRCSHAELDEAETLDEGDPVELGAQYRSLRSRLPQINVLGGCCGTDHRHIEQIARACLQPEADYAIG